MVVSWILLKKFALCCILDVLKFDFFSFIHLQIIFITLSYWWNFVFSSIYRKVLFRLSNRSSCLWWMPSSVPYRNRSTKMTILPRMSANCSRGAISFSSLLSSLTTSQKWSLPKVRMCNSCVFESRLFFILSFGWNYSSMCS